MKFIRNSEPYVFQHECSQREKGLQMNFAEKKELLVNNLLDIYGQCGTKAEIYKKPNKSFLAKIFTKGDSVVYPDIVINDYHGTKGDTAYYYVLPKGSTLDPNKMPKEIQDSWVKIIYGSVFCLEKQVPDLYVKGCSYVSQYISEAVFPNTV